MTIDIDGREQVHDYDPIGYKGATNNQMEIQACIEALTVAVSNYPPVDVGNYSKIVIYTDSTYVVENFPHAKYAWPKTGWTTRDGAPVLNAHLWKDLIRLVKRLDRFGKRVDIKWVKGHKRSTHNKAVDKLAKRSAKQPSRQTASIVKVRRKKSPRNVERGSVGMLGQRATIRIITEEYLRVQRRNKYMYEVMSKKSLFYRGVDVAFSDISLRAGHTYHVRFNEDSRNPQIVKLYREMVLT